MNGYHLLCEEMAETKAKIVKNRYHIVDVLGKGGFGQVYLVEDLEEKEKNGSFKRKALKMVNKFQWEIDKLEREADVHCALKHPCVLAFHESFTIGSYIYILTEYCEGGDLHDRIYGEVYVGESIPENNIQQWIIQILAGLRYLHKQKILHRDIKPKNILLKRDIIKIADFGISRFQMTTLAQTFIGTPLYMSPEMLNDQGCDDKSDVWAVGCIVYELAAKRPLFKSLNLDVTVMMIKNVQLRKWPGGFSRELKDLFKTIMVKDRRHRPSALDIQRHPYIVDGMDVCIRQRFQTESTDSDGQNSAFEMTARKTRKERTQSRSEHEHDRNSAVRTTYRSTRTELAESTDQQDSGSRARIKDSIMVQKARDRRPDHCTQETEQVKPTGSSTHDSPLDLFREVITNLAKGHATEGERTDSGITDLECSTNDKGKTDIKQLTSDSAVGMTESFEGDDVSHSDADSLRELARCFAACVQDDSYTPLCDDGEGFQTVIEVSKHKRTDSQRKRTS